MQSKSRYVVVGVLALAVITAMVLSHGFEYLWVRVGLDDFPLFGVRQFSISRVLGYGLAAIAAVFVLKHQPTFALANEVVDELAKVTWPSREETGNATVVVIITVLISSVYLGAFDAVWLALTDWILGIEPLQGG